MSMVLQYTPNCSAPVSGTASAMFTLGDSHLQVDDLDVTYYHCAAEDSSIYAPYM